MQKKRWAWPVAEGLAHIFLPTPSQATVPVDIAGPIGHHSCVAFRLPVHSSVLPIQVPDFPERTVAVLWPTIGSLRLGRFVGRLCAVRLGRGFFTLGKLFALATIPLSLAAFAWLFAPYVARRYRLTNRRIVVQRGLRPVDERAIDFEEFDAIEVQRLSGQEWLRSGDLVFVRDGREVFRLSGVARPEVCRELCLKARTASLSVRQVLQSQAASQQPSSTTAGA